MRSSVYRVLPLAAVGMVALPTLAMAQSVPSPEEGVFVPLVPCRIYKSVTANNNTPLPANNYATVNVSRQNSYASQGGPSNSTGCGVPASATAVAVSVTTSHATSTGTLAAFIPGNTSPAPGIAITFTPSFSQTTGLAIGLASGAFQVEPVGGATNVTVDVTGYWAPQLEAYVGASGSLVTATARVLSATLSSTGVYVLTVDRDVGVCSVTASPETGQAAFATAVTDGNNIFVDVYGFSGGSPTLTNLAFNVSVLC